MSRVEVFFASNDTIQKPFELDQKPNTSDPELSVLIACYCALVARMAGNIIGVDVKSQSEKVNHLASQMEPRPSPP